jgi:hypothetical protein
MKGVVNPPLSAFASCVVMSLFTNVTVVPTATFNGLGENAVVVKLNAPLIIETFAAPPVGVGVGVGLGVGEGAGVLLLHAVRHSPARRITPNRIVMRDRGAKTLPCGLRDFWPVLREEVVRMFREAESFSVCVTRVVSLGCIVPGLARFLGVRFDQQLDASAGIGVFHAFV